MSARFSFFKAPITNTKPSLPDVYRYIRGGFARQQTKQLRRIEDIKTARAYKVRNFHYCTFSGIFSTRSDKALIVHSGLLCIDFDHLSDTEELKATLLQDNYFDTQLLFRSPSGHGLKWIIPIDTSAISMTPILMQSLPIFSPIMGLLPIRHAGTFPEPVSSLSIPTLTSTLKSSSTMNKKTFNTADWLPQPAHEIIPNDDIETVTSRIEAMGIDITGDYATWRDIGFAIADEKGESGREIFHRISRFYPGYTREETDKQYTACLNHNGTGVTIRTFFQAAKSAGVDIACAAAHPAYSAQSAQTSLRKMTVCADSQPAQSLMDAPTFSHRVKDHLPEYLETVADMGESTKDADILIIGTIATPSACIPNVFGIYDGLTVYPNLFFFLTARASSGKGRLGLCRYLVDPIHDHLRADL